MAARERERALRRQVFQPAPDLTLSQWSDQHRQLDRSSSSEPGQWRTDRFPAQRAIMDALSDPTIEEVNWMKSAQVGATEVICNWIGYIIDHDPGPMLIVEPTDKMAKTLSNDRISPMLKSTPRVRERMRRETGGRRNAGDTILYKQFAGGHMTLVTARSAADMAMRPIRYVALDEVNRYPQSAGKEGRPDNLAIMRTETFWNRKIYRASTPTVDGAGGIEVDFERTEQQRLFYPCPHCGEWDRLRWRSDDGTPRVVWDKDVSASGVTRHLPATAVYVCPHCAGVIDEQARQAMLLLGEWRQTAPENYNPKVRGFHMSSLDSPWSSLEKLAGEFVAAAHDVEALKTFVNTRLGEVFIEEGSKFSASELASRCEPYGAEVPRDVGVLTAFVDVQDDRLEVKVKGWGAGEESWLILHEVVTGDPGQAAVWDEVDQTYLTRAYQHEAGGVLRIRAVGVDSGGHHSDAVYRFCRQRRARRIFATKGHATRNQPIWPEKPPKKPGRGGVRVWMVGTDTAKDKILLSRLRIVNADGKPFGPGAMHFPEGTPEPYFTGLTSEVKRPKTVNGRTLHVWEKLSGRRNEPLDCEVGCLAMLRALGKSVYDHLDREVARVVADGAKAAAVEPAKEPEQPPESFTESQIRRRQPKRSRRSWVNNWRRG